MSFAKNLRQRFKPDRAEDSPKKQNQAAEDIFEFMESPDECKQAFSMEKGKVTNLEESQGSQGTPTTESASIGWLNAEEKKIFEDQLSQIQEQLMMTMIENQRLESELVQYRNTSELEKVRCELTYERHRCELLEKNLEQAIKKKSNKVQRSHSDLTSRNRVAPPGGGDGSAGIPVSSVDKTDGSDDVQDSPVLTRRKRIYGRFVNYFSDIIYTFLEDFTEEPVTNSVTNPEGDPLTVKTLKDNIKRFGTEAKPYVNTVRGIYDILAWKSPPYTLIIFVVYMYSVWQGWFLPVFFFCLSFRLFINYLRYRGWNVSFNFFETVEEQKETEDKDLGVTDKLSLVMHVARKVQNFLGVLVDSLEKIKSLLTWRHPQATQQLFLAVNVAFITSCIFPTPLLFFYAGLYLGVKLFIIDCIFERFPRVKRKYDSTWRMWQELPTDLEYEKRYVKSEIDKYILPHGQEKSDSPLEASRGENVSMDDRTFCELFSLPDSECPLPGWHGGRRCTLINREKSLTAAFKNGKLYLTHSFLCFERTKVPSPKNIVIPLTDISRLEKAKPYSWIPGGGMAIEIAVVGNDKHFLLGGMLNRDELFDSICEAGLRKYQECKSEDKCLPWMGNQKGKKHFMPKHFQPFSLADVYEDDD